MNEGHSIRKKLKQNKSFFNFYSMNAYFAFFEIYPSQKELPT